MTKQEAIQEMNKGVKITHWLFTPNEYVYIHPIEKYRVNTNYEDGWSEWKEVKNEG